MLIKHYYCIKWDKIIKYFISFSMIVMFRAAIVCSLKISLTDGVYESYSVDDHDVISGQCPSNTTERFVDGLDADLVACTSRDIEGYFSKAISTCEGL